MSIEEILVLLKGVKDGEIVAVPRAQYEALMAAEEFIRHYLMNAEKIGERGGLRPKAESVLAALRAAGIHIEGEGK